MKLLPRSVVGWLTAFICASSIAADTASSVATTSVNATPVNLLQTVISLVVVVGALILLAVLFKKFGLNRMYSSVPFKIIGAISIGNNQRIMVMEAGDQWIVLGVTPHHISTITTMPRQEAIEANVNVMGSVNGAVGNNNFPAWLQNAIKNYREKKS